MSNYSPQNEVGGGVTPLFPATANIPQGSAPAFSSVPYVGPELKRQFGDPLPSRDQHKKCMFERTDGNLCRGPRAKSTDYCVGHLRKLGLLDKPQPEAPQEES